MSQWTLGVLMAGLVGLGACGGSGREAASASSAETKAPAANMADKVNQYTPVRLTADLSRLSDRERRMLPLLIDAAAAIGLPVGATSR